MLAEVAEEAGFPAGVINVVTHAPGAAGAIADEFFDRPEVRVINLIGGVKTARMLAERAGRLLKRTVMELGGFNPMIILDDVDMDTRSARRRLDRSFIRARSVSTRAESSFSARSPKSSSASSWLGPAACRQAIL